MAGLPWRLDFIGRQESLNADWNRLREMVPHVPFPPISTSTGLNIAEGRKDQGTRNKLLDWLLKNRTAETTLLSVCKNLISDSFDWIDNEKEKNGTTRAVALSMLRSEERDTQSF
jgi:hypothetical protein